MADENLLSLEDKDDDELDETLAERIIGLSEMFPQSLRTTTCALCSLSLNYAKMLYSVTRTVAWVFVSSATIIVLPALFESERAQAQEQQLQQQRQILLGPNAAVSGSTPGLLPGVGSAPPRV
ncbi:mitochondrial import receptor subunit TOM22 homolog [Octopus sinensis]|uniref:Mitochondrial import receptor subunit TOM22 homolog n=1 Tax=Octopus sinensis TaxID=2607531 RepID=A0A6P7TS84_9MOLL|nr:mitochondrial import receptor subunit TOM22 homolog [Octopus sinensis]